LEFKELATNPWGILAIAIVGPIVEEIVFREGIIRYLLRHGEHRKYAVLFSAVVFGLIHFNPAQIPFAIITGIILGIIYVKSGSIIITSLIHILNNTAALIEMRLTDGTINEDHKFTEALGGPMLTWIYIIVFSSLCIVFMKTFISNYRKKPAKSKKQEEKVKEYY
jgi:membrane protease YdiL (CAAX protease family)